MLVQTEGDFEIINDLLGQLGGLVGLLDMGLDQRELVAAQACQSALACAVGTNPVSQGL